MLEFIHHHNEKFAPRITVVCVYDKNETPWKKVFSKIERERERRKKR